MPIKVHPSCIVRLKAILREAIKALQVTYGIILGWQSIEALRLLDAALPKIEAQPVSLLDMTDERPLSAFAADRIGRRRSGVGVFRQLALQVPEPLFGIGAFQDIAPVAQEVIADFASMSWDYLFNLRLPRPIGPVLQPLFGETGRMEVGAGIMPVPMQRGA